MNDTEILEFIAEQAAKGLTGTLEEIDASMAIADRLDEAMLRALRDRATPVEAVRRAVTEIRNAQSAVSKEKP